uniref:Mediator of DNA damage checkpoint protein 1 n=1 Tax=Gouania willdenowi TaxID=441366 RepID=A0A8C5HDU6_GOUWI
MDATQAISDSILESDEEENENKRGKPLAKLCILKNQHIPEKEFPLFLGENVLGRDPSTCTLLLSAPSVSKQHATISVSVYRRRHAHNEMDMEALVWDRGSMNGTHKGRLKLTPNVRYALSDADGLLVADIPCRYVSCGPGAGSSQADANTIGSTNSGVEDSVTEEGRKDTSISGLRLTESPKRSPVRESCLLFEQTPNQQQGTLVPESDSDSENQTGGERLQKTYDSHKSSPKCSTFLSPASTTVPESEDESIITPSSSTSKRSQQHVCFTTEETEIVNDSVLENGTRSKGSDQHQIQEDIVLDKSGLHDSPSGSTNDAVPVFTMDSDSDVAEGEAAPSLGNTAQQSDRPPHLLRFDIDSDTDIDEDEDVPCRSFQSVPSSHKRVNTPPPVISHIQPEGIAVSSDSDKGEDAVMSDADAATKAKSTSFQSAADGASSEQLSDFHLDSDTDVDEETEQKENSDLGLVEPKPVPAVPQSLHIESDTDDDLPASTINKSATDAVVTEPHCAELDILSDSDTDVDDDDVPFPVAAVVSPQPKAAQSDSDANTDVDESAVAPVEDGANPPDVCADSDTDVEGKDTDIEEERVPGLQRENTPGMLAPFLQNCSTPIQLTDEVEEMETQAFTSSSSGTFRLAPEVRPVQMSPGSNSQAEDDFIVAETQSFILHPQAHQMSMETTNALVHDSALDKSQDNTSRVQSFQLGLSESSHLQSHDKALAIESPQSFPSVEVGVHLEETQAYAAFSNADNVSVDTTDDEEEEEAMTSGVFDREEQEDMALQATQAYISASCYDAGCEEEEEERQNSASTDTQPMDFTDSSTPTMAETQLMVPSLAVSLNVSSHVRFAQHSEVKHQKEEDQQHTLSETQPMQTTDTEDSDGGEFSPPLNEKEKSPKDELIIAATQPIQAHESPPTDVGEDVESDADSIPKSNLSIAEPLPRQDEVQSSMSAEGCTAESKNGQNQEEDLIQGCQNQKAEEQKTGLAPSMDAACADTQPAVIDEEEDSPDLILGPLKRKAKPLQIEDESQSQTSSEVCAGETQPLNQCKVEQSHEVNLNQASRKSEDEQSLEMESGKDDNVAKLRSQREKSQRDTRINNRDQGQMSRPQRGKKAKLAQRNEEKVAAQMEQQKEKEEEKKLHCEQVKVKKSKVLAKDKNEKNEKEPQTPARARRGTIRTGAPLISELPVSTQDDVPARRTRSHSNSSNSVSPERFALSSITKESKGRGRGRGGKRLSDTPQVTPVRTTRRRTIPAAEPQSTHVNPPEVISKPNLQSSVSSANRGRRGRKTELVSDSHNQVISESDTHSTPPERVGRRRKTERSSSQAYTQRSSTTRGQQQQVTISISEPAATDEQSLNQEEEFPKQEALYLKRNVRGQGQKPEKNNEEEALVPNVRKGSDEGKSKGKGKKKDWFNTTDNNDGGTEKAAESEGKIGSEFRSPAVQVKTRTRASSARAKKEESKNPSKEEEEVGNLGRRARGRSSAVPKMKKEVEEKEISNIIVTQDANMEASEPPPTPTSHLSRKRKASAVSSPAAKSPRSSAASPASVSGRLRAVSQVYKVLFTGVVDEAGEKVLARLGGVVANGVDDMNCLVTDKVRRTVKFLCAVAKGVPVVTTNWLEKSGKAGSFLDPNAFLVKDPEQEKKFSFCLSDSLKNAHQQLLLQGYEIHVTKSVKPEPAHMKEIISSSGATFLSKMPSSQKPQTLVISCEDDWPLCAPALSASLPVVTAEFILTGILQQSIDFQTHKLSAPMANLQPAAGRGRSRKKT